MGLNSQMYKYQNMTQKCSQKDVIAISFTVEKFFPVFTLHPYFFQVLKGWVYFYALHFNRLTYCVSVTWVGWKAGQRGT